VFAALSEIRSAHAVLVEEAPSNHADLHEAWPITEPDTFYTFASGGLGWNLPASVGIALAERETGRNRPVVAVIGDGSFQYSVQSIWSAAQLQLPILIVIMRNRQYTILKSFAELEQTPGVPASISPAWTSCRSRRARSHRWSDRTRRSRECRSSRRGAAVPRRATPRRIWRTCPDTPWSTPSKHPRKPLVTPEVAGSSPVAP
jgi:Thiamine pyrophosphate enzyme, C-terminal TPP binding domain